MAKRPKFNGSFAAKNRDVKALGDFENYEFKVPTFSFKYLDMESYPDWSWVNYDSEIHEVIEFLKNMSNLTWNEIMNQRTGNDGRRQKHHFQEFHTIIPEANKIIKKFKYDEVFENLFRFRLGGVHRLWGFLKNGVFYVLWWDRDHKIYPID